jgi:hypothetical protein
MRNGSLVTPDLSVADRIASIAGLSMDSRDEEESRSKTYEVGNRCGKPFQLQLVVFQSQQWVDFGSPQCRNKIGDQSYCNEKK